MATREPIEDIPDFPLYVDGDHCFKVVLDVPDGVEPVSNPAMPGGPTIHPKQLLLLIYPRQPDDQWMTVTANVVGPRVDSKSPSPRWVNVLFVEVLTEGSQHVPEMIRAQARKWVARLNSMRG